MSPHTHIFIHICINILQTSKKINQNRILFAMCANSLSITPVNFKTHKKSIKFYSVWLYKCNNINLLRINVVYITNIESYHLFQVVICSYSQYRDIVNPCVSTRAVEETGLIPVNFKPGGLGRLD